MTVDHCSVGKTGTLIDRKSNHFNRGQLLHVFTSQSEILVIIKTTIKCMSNINTFKMWLN